MQYQNARIRGYRSGAAAMVASFLLMAVTAATAKPCLTKEEARKLWPNEWLYECEPGRRSAAKLLTVSHSPFFVSIATYLS